MQSITNILLEANTKELFRASVSVANNTNTKAQAHVAQTLPQVRLIAEKLAARLHNPSRFRYYCKIAWHLPEGRIWANLELALTGQNPARYFSYLCSLELR